MEEVGVGWAPGKFHTRSWMRHACEGPCDRISKQDGEREEVGLEDAELAGCIEDPGLYPSGDWGTTKKYSQESG